MKQKYPDDVQCHPNCREAEGDPPVEHPPHAYSPRRAKLMKAPAKKKAAAK